MQCRIDSYPPPVIQWVKVIQGRDANQVILSDSDPQVIDIFTQQIDSTNYETKLTVFAFSLFILTFSFDFEYSIIH